MGLFAEAEDCLRSALFEHYRDQSLMDDYRQCRQIARYLPTGSAALHSDELLLTPLRLCHENDFFWQYSAEIAELSKLPDFNEDDEEDLCQWVTDYQRRPTSTMFAINHRDWGFTGSTGIDISRGVGFIFYWLGADFQGENFAPQAVALLLDWATRYLDLHCCYAVVYEDNSPLESVLRKLDFRPILLKIADDYGEEYEQEYAWYRGPYKTDRLLFFELNQLFIDIDSELRVLALPASSGWE